MSRSQFTPSVAQRQLVLKLAACGTSGSEICTLGMDARGRPVCEQILRARFAQESLKGTVRTNNNVAQSL
ncbi:hypothetical protein IAG25_15260 [Caballeronia sp. EK]|uniref:hypothetical protein n=1 Tax=Caballeronia sp. EK TaxID=2767469 RepID=UPI001655BE5C|nr:hypothetical protein [Caballeronia sp. EK]MBC8638179.1 hypothetical protein [Caballeronia sp. EK]